MSNPVCGIISLSIKAIDELIRGEYKLWNTIQNEACTYLSSEPPLAQVLLLELHLKEIENLPELTL